MNTPNTEQNQDLSSQEDEKVVLPEIPIPGDNEVKLDTDEKNEDSQEEGSESSESQEESSDDKNQKPKKSNPFSKRLRKKNDRIAELEAKLAEREQPANQTQEQPEEIKGPNPDNYEHGINDINYINDLAVHNGKEAGRQAYQEARQADERLAKEQQVQQTVQKAESNFVSKMDKAWNDHKDFAQVWETGGFDHDPAVMHALKSHAEAGELTYQILKNPELSREMMQMDPVTAISKIGELGAKLTPVRPKNKTGKSSMPEPFEPLNTGKPNVRPEFSEDMSNDQFSARYPIDF